MCVPKYLKVLLLLKSKRMVESVNKVSLNGNGF
jgi:hypothetical protein